MFESKIILELGCGLKKEFKDSVGIDVIPYPCVDIVLDLEHSSLPFDDNSVDLIYTHNVIEHVMNARHVIRECSRVLKDKGELHITTCHYSSPAAYNNLEHVRFFGLLSFKDWYDKSMAIKSMRLRYCVTDNKTLSYLGLLLDFMANVHPLFCERIWANWVGGFDEMKVVLIKEVLK